MNPPVLLLAALLSCCPGDSSVHGPPETVLALAGGDVTLPCSFIFKANEDFPTVEWSKKGLKPDVVFLYRDGCETPEMKNPAFRYRTSLITKELIKGNISLRISNVRLSDAGMYQCMRLRRTAPRDITAVELFVGAVSEPKLSVVPAEGGDVTLQCAADCWLPEPEIDFLDERGNDIGGDEPKRERDASGCYSVRRRVTVRDANERVTCRVHQPNINQTREAEILLPVVGKRSCILTAGIAAGIVALLLGAGGLGVFLWKRCGKSVRELDSPSSFNRDSFEDRSLLPVVRVVQAENRRNTTIEMLTMQVKDLQLRLSEKEDTILQLRINNAAQLATCVCQDDEPVFLPATFADSSLLTSGNLPQKKRPGISRRLSQQTHTPHVDTSNRRHSTPARLDFASFGSSSSRRLSDAFAFGPGPNAKLQRPHFSAFPSSAMSNNHVTLLANVTEEVEMLIA